MVYNFKKIINIPSVTCNAVNRKTDVAVSIFIYKYEVDVDRE